jgi:quinoprotein glucose dehydrogenase
MHCDLDVKHKAVKIDSISQELLKRNIPITGSENFGGPTTTNSGIIFISGTIDKLIRAFDTKSGKEIWRHQLPFVGSVSPITYKSHGCQFVFISATGQNKLEFYGSSLGNYFAAFKLKSCKPSSK